MSTTDASPTPTGAAGADPTAANPGPGGPSAPPAPAAATAKAIPLTGVALGIDVGGTGVKAALIDLATAELLTSRIREKTPQPSEPAAVIDTIVTVVERVLAEYGGPLEDLPVGCGLPGPIKHGRMKMAANLDQGWVDFDATTVLTERLGRPVHVINDADAAGMAELAYGEARDHGGTVILLTIGTGIGSALISEGRLVPNTEFGHLEMRRKAAETLISGAARTRRRLGWKRWGREFNAYLAMLEFYFWPDRIILGGGVSKESKRYWQYLRTRCTLVGARYLNTSGIIGAAYGAALAVHGEREAAEVAEATAPRRARERRSASDASGSGRRAAGGQPRSRRSGSSSSGSSSSGSRKTRG